MKASAKYFVSLFLSSPLVSPFARFAFGFFARAFAHFARYSEKARRLASVSVHTGLPSSRRARLAAVVKYYRQLGGLVPSLPLQPKLSVLIPVYKVSPHYLRETLQSVSIQTYPHWEVCIVDDASGMPELEKVVRAFQERHPGKVKYRIHTENLHISATSNSCLALASGDYVALLDHDDRLYPNALAEMVRAINFYEAPEILYSDERHVEEDGALRGSPFFKPAWSPFLHLGVNYTTHLSVYSLPLLRNIGGFRVGFEGSQDHDLMLRAVEASTRPVVHVPLCLYQWRAHPQSTAQSRDSKPYAALAGEKAVAEALERRGRPAQVAWNRETERYHIQFALPKPEPMVSILVPARDQAHLTEACLHSLFTLSSYPSFEVILIDNGSVTPEAKELAQRWREREPTRFSILQDSGPFNFARLNNSAAREARGAFLVLLNNDTEIVTPGWLEELVMLAQWPEVGAVGPKLLYPNGTLQHAGLRLVDRLIALHVGSGLPKNSRIYSGLLQTLHEVPAVTGACLCVSKEKYFAVGGLDEKWAPNAFGDVDFCLNLGANGWASLYTPHAVLVHHESPSRKVTIESFEKFYLLQKHGQRLLNDPYLNPNLLRCSNFEPSPESASLELDSEEFSALLSTPPELWAASFLRGEV